MAETHSNGWTRDAFLGAVSILVIAIIAFYGLSLTQANADYICTEVINPTDTSCTAGSWSPWTTTSTNSDGSINQERTYTGEEQLSQTIIYVTYDSGCSGNFTGSGNSADGTFGGDSHSGDAGWQAWAQSGGPLPGQQQITTQYQACQITQTQTLASGAGGGNGGQSALNTTQTVQASGTIQTGTVIVGAIDQGFLDRYPGAIPATSTLSVNPALVHQGETTHVVWTSQGTQSCTVTGGNGDSWTELNSPTTGETSSAINQQTVYTLNCQGYDGKALVEQATVNITPNFQEQ